MSCTFPGCVHLHHRRSPACVRSPGEHRHDRQAQQHPRRDADTGRPCARIAGRRDARRAAGRADPTGTTPSLSPLRQALDIGLTAPQDHRRAGYSQDRLCQLERECRASPARRRRDQHLQDRPAADATTGARGEDAFSASLHVRHLRDNQGGIRLVPASPDLHEAVTALDDLLVR